MKKPTAADVTNKARDSAVDRAGAALYGGSWIGLLEERERKIGCDPIRKIPADGRRAAHVLQARFRVESSDTQTRMVFRWLHDRGIDCTAKGFHQETFERRFRELFPNSAPLQERRRAAIKKRIDAGEQPGRGGAVQWKAFAAAICADCGGADFDIKTLQRDYRKMYPSESG